MPSPPALPQPSTDTLADSEQAADSEDSAVRRHPDPAIRESVADWELSTSAPEALGTSSEVDSAPRSKSRSSEWRPYLVAAVLVIGSWGVYSLAQYQSRVTTERAVAGHAASLAEVEFLSTMMRSDSFEYEMDREQYEKDVIRAFLPTLRKGPVRDQAHAQLNRLNHVRPEGPVDITVDETAIGMEEANDDRVASFEKLLEELNGRVRKAEKAAKKAKKLAEAAQSAASSRPTSEGATSGNGGKAPSSSLSRELDRLMMKNSRKPARVRLTP